MLTHEIDKTNALTAQQNSKRQLEEEKEIADFKHTKSLLELTLQQLDQEKSKLHEEEKEMYESERTIARLKLEIETRKHQGMMDINELERDKYNAVQRIQKVMDYKVLETQANLMALNDEQLQTTTRLTIL